LVTATSRPAQPKTHLFASIDRRSLTRPPASLECANCGTDTVLVLFGPRREREAGMDRRRITAIAARAHERLAAAEEEEMRARYELGRTLREISMTESDASRTLEAVASILGRDPSLLRRYMRVASVIPPAQFEAFATMRGNRGLSMSWSHIEHLADVRSMKLRSIIAEQVIAEELSVRELVERLKNAVTDAEPPTLQRESGVMATHPESAVSRVQAILSSRRG
jgi:hypothetical protein